MAEETPQVPRRRRGRVRVPATPPEEPKTTDKDTKKKDTKKSDS